MDEALRFSRERLAGYDPERLRHARVLLVGAGALGQNVALCLALSGVGQIVIVDFDTFEEHNRTRSPFYVSGAPKAPAVAEGFGRLATALDARALGTVAAIQEIGDLVIAWSEVVVAAVDSREARGYLAERTRLHGRPLIEGGFDAFDLTLSAFANASPTEPCWRCGRGLLADGAERGLCSLYARRAEEAGAVPAVQSGAQAAGAAVAEAAIAALHGELPLASCRWTVNLRTGRGRVSQLTQDPACLGVHEPLQDEPAGLTVACDASVRALLAELAFHGPSPCVHLPAPYAHAMPCSTCGGLAPVGRMLWQVRTPPVCAGACSTTLPPLPRIVSVLEERHHDLLDLPCRQVGLHDGGAFEVAFADDRTRWFRMPGMVSLSSARGDLTTTPFASTTPSSKE